MDEKGKYKVNIRINKWLITVNTNIWLMFHLQKFPHFYLHTLKLSRTRCLIHYTNNLHIQHSYLLKIELFDLSLCAYIENLGIFLTIFGHLILFHFWPLLWVILLFSLNFLDYFYVYFPTNSKKSQ